MRLSGTPKLRAAAVLAMIGVLGGGLWPAGAQAHVASIAASGAAFQWSWDPWVIAGLGLSAWLYGTGLRRLWRVSGRGRRILRSEAAAFWCGWIALVVALVSPLDPLGTQLFSAHMVQHEVLMLMAAPLLVMSRPLAVFVWALPPGWRRSIGATVKRPSWQALWSLLTHPLCAWLLHAAAIWGWHAPALFRAALTSELVHTLQHLSFLITALLFWWSATRGAPGSRNRAIGVVSVFGTAVHTALLGALLTVAPRPLYAVDPDAVAAWGLTPLEDQQLGGLIMWVPGALAYVIVGAILVARILNRPGDPATAGAPAEPTTGPSAIRAASVKAGRGLRWRQSPCRCRSR